jgi:hypothetical protein
MWFSSVSVVLGAIIWRILTEQFAGIDTDIVGLVFMIAGAIGLTISSVTLAASLGRGPRGFLHSRSPILEAITTSDSRTDGATHATSQLLN